MREAARALDDVSDHLGEVLRHADELLAEWARFGAEVRTQVAREAAAIGEVVDGAVERAASSGIDRAIADRLRTLTAEIERLEQRTRAASRAVAEQRDADRRVLWIVVAGIVLANALLVALLLRKPEPAPVAEPIRIEATSAPPSEAARGSAAGSGDPASAGSAAATAEGSSSPAAAAMAGSNAPAGPSTGPNTGPNTGSSTGPNTPAGASAAGTKPAAGGPANASAKPAQPGAARPGDAAGSAKPAMSPIALPPKAGTARPHKKP